MNSNELLTAAGAVPRVLVALVPVQLFLLGLLALDSYRLVRPRRVLLAVLAGVVAASLSFVANNVLMDLLGWSLVPFAILVAPLVEETAKGVYSDWLVRTRRTGFLVDATVLGFATGAGFATAENLYYLKMLPDAPLLIWAIRGLGTAVMHGGAAALFAVLRMAWATNGRGPAHAWLVALPAAYAFHAAFNQAMAYPVPATLVLVAVLPLVLRMVYRHGERRLRVWLGQGFDRDSELLALIAAGEVRTTPLGRYLESLRAGFRPETVVDMLCLLRLEAELSLRVKGSLLLREHGFRAAPDPAVAERLEELRWLEGSLGRAALIALRPVRPWHGRDRWQRQLLEGEAGEP